MGCVCACDDGVGWPVRPPLSSLFSTLSLLSCRLGADPLLSSSLPDTTGFFRRHPRSHHPTRGPIAVLCSNRGPFLSPHPSFFPLARSLVLRGRFILAVCLTDRLHRLWRPPRPRLQGRGIGEPVRPFSLSISFPSAFLFRDRVADVFVARTGRTSDTALTACRLSTTTLRSKSVRDEI